MASNAYHFITHWRIKADMHDVAAIIANGPDLVRWWPSVYLDVREIEPGEKSGVGKVLSLYTKGWLPYTLRWEFRVASVEYGRSFTIEAWGDFAGRGIWTFAQDGDDALVTYDWKISAEKPLLKRLSPLLRPIFSANHQWAMRMGEKSLRLELARRGAKTPAELAAIPAPPGPTRMSGQLLAAGAAAASIASGALLYRRLRRPRHTT